MPILKPRHAWIAGLVGCLCMAWLIGCPFSRSSRITPQKLHGTWRTTLDEGDMSLTFSPDGTLQLRVVPRSGWVRFFAGEPILGGRWRLEGDRLTVELSETPGIVALLGENWRGRTITSRILHLTENELQLSDSDQPYHRALLPPE